MIEKITTYAKCDFKKNVSTDSFATNDMFSKWHPK